jgi:hypothetical protein
MSQVICSSCFEVEDTTKRFIELPYVCALCEKDSALAIEQDVWETEYVGPACQQAAEEVHGLYIEAEDNIPCDAATYYVVEARSKLNKSYSWFRSQNPGTEGVFDDYSTALEAAEREQDGSIEYRVVEYRPEPTPCDVPYNSGVPCQSALDNLPPRTRCCFDPPCQSALDSVQEEQYLDPYCVGTTDPRVHAMHSGDILDQFDADTELINGLTTENDDLKMKLSQANLNIQIQGEIIADLENTVGAYRVIFRIPGC